MFQIDQFKSQMSGGLARPTHFQVQMVNPIDPSGDQKLLFTCKAASFPASIIGVMPVFYFGRQVKHAGDREFEDWTITAYNDEDFVVYNSLKRWSSAINEHKANARGRGATANPRSYWSDVIVRQYGKQGNSTPLKECKLRDAWPSRVGEIVTDWESVNQPETFQCIFSYNEYTDDTTDDFAG